MSIIFQLFILSFVILILSEICPIQSRYSGASSICFQLCSQRVSRNRYHYYERRLWNCVDDCEDYYEWVLFERSYAPRYKMRSQRAHEIQAPDNLDLPSDQYETQPEEDYAYYDDDQSNDQDHFVTLSQPKHCGYKSSEDVSKPGIADFIVGGVDAEQNEFPWMVSIQYKTDDDKSSHFCGDSIITSKYILTAAHCMDSYENKEKELIIKIGVNNPSEDSHQSLVADKVIVHEGWDAETQVNDISLIRLKTPIKYTTSSSGKYRVNCLALPISSADPKGTALLAGWGELKYGTGVPSDWLQKVNLPIVDRTTCSKNYKDYLAKYVPLSKIKINDQYVCAAGEGNHDACRGDSGGPLMQVKGQRTFQLGIVSFSIPCAVKGMPSIYTNVIYFMDWLKKNII